MLTLAPGRRIEREGAIFFHSWGHESLSLIKAREGIVFSTTFQLPTLQQKGFDKSEKSILGKNQSKTKENKIHPSSPNSANICRQQLNVQLKSML